MPAIRSLQPNLGSQLREQWSNPGDIFSLLLLIGGDIVQMALAQLVGVRISITEHLRVPVTPVAFSFGWVAYAFSSLKDIVGDGNLMPETDVPSQVINCSSGYARTNHAWILGRVLRDHEKRTPVDRKRISIRIDIFEGQDKLAPDMDVTWWTGWAVIGVQHVVAIIPWILYGDWSKLLVTFGGTLGALATGSLPQWRLEKWAPCRLGQGKKKVTALTRGNGHAHVMVFIHSDGQWDVEAMASASSEGRLETRYLIVLLSVWWTLLLITCSGLQENTWYLVAVGGLGMLQNIIVAGASRRAGAFNFHVIPQSSIIGYKKSRSDVIEPDNSDPEDNEDPINSVGGVMGALMELERRIPGAGASLVNIFFPRKLEYGKGKFPFIRERKFWKFAYQTMKQRKECILENREIEI